MLAPVDNIPAFLDRRPFVGTFTNLQAFRNCEHAFYRRYIKRDQPYVETEAMRFGNEVHAAFEQRLNKTRKPLPPSMQQWEHFAAPFDKYEVLTEQKLGMTDRARQTGFFDSDVWFRGKADVVVLQLDKGMAFIADWKTGKSVFEDPFELATNALLLKVNYPELKKILGSYAWIKENRMSQQYDLSDFKSTFMEIGRLMKLVVEKRKSGEWTKKKSGLCGWCSVADCENYFVAGKTGNYHLNVVRTAGCAENII